MAPRTAVDGELSEGASVTVLALDVNLVLYHGALAPRAAWRASVVPRPAPAAAASAGTDPRPREGRGWRWGRPERRVFAIDVLACPSCGWRLRLLAVIEASPATVRILQHLHLPTEVPAPAPARASPVPDEWAD